MSCPLVPGQKYDVVFWSESAELALRGLTFDDFLGGLLIFSELCDATATVSAAGVSEGRRRRFLNLSWIRQIDDHISEPADERDVERQSHAGGGDTTAPARS